MLVIRLLRTGKKNQPFFKLVATDKRKSPRGGRFREKLGFYNPLTKERTIKKERVLYWLSKGAQLSNTAHNLLVKEGIIKQAKIAVHKKSKKEEGKPSSVPLKSGTMAGKEEKPKETPKKPEEPLKQETPKKETLAKPEEPLKKEEAKQEKPADIKKQEAQKPKTPNKEE